jgi:hypothetical protein
MVESTLLEPLQNDEAGFDVVAAGESISAIVRMTAALPQNEQSAITDALDNFCVAWRDGAAFGRRTDEIIRTGTGATLETFRERLSGLAPLLDEMKRAMGAFQDLQEALERGVPGPTFQTLEVDAAKNVQKVLARKHFLLVQVCERRKWSDSFKAVFDAWHDDSPGRELLLKEVCKILPDYLEASAANIQIGESYFRRLLPAKAARLDKIGVVVSNLAKDCANYAILCDFSRSTLEDKSLATEDSALQWALVRICTLMDVVSDFTNAGPAQGPLTRGILLRLMDGIDEHMADVQRAIDDLSPFRRVSECESSSIEDVDLGHEAWKLAGSLQRTMIPLRNNALALADEYRDGSLSELDADLADDAARLYIADDEYRRYRDAVDIDDPDDKGPMTQKAAIVAARQARDEVLRQAHADRARESLLNEITSAPADAGGPSRSRRKKKKRKPAPAPAIPTAPSRAEPPDRTPKLTAAEAQSRAGALAKFAEDEVRSTAAPRSRKYIETRLGEALRCLADAAQSLRGQGHAGLAKTLQAQADGLREQATALTNAQDRKLLVHSPSRAHYEQIADQVSIRKGRQNVKLAPVSDTNWLRRRGEYVDEYIISLNGTPPRVPGPQGLPIDEREVVFHVHRQPDSERYIAAHFKKRYEQTAGAGAFRSLVFDRQFIDNLIGRAG